jgi:D-glycero-D-manno-heptose 1,7-bisphosphate phosphatase
MSESIKYVLLDRDGVINADSDNYIRSPEQWQALPNSLQAMSNLAAAGYRVVVISNQSGIGRGYYSIATLHAIQRKMYQQIRAAGGDLYAIYYCPHHPQQDCQCRKPKPGMLEQFSRDAHVSLRQLVLIGDKLSDLQAAQCVGASPILVRSGKGESVVAQATAMHVPIYENLYEASNALIQNPA